MTGAANPLRPEFRELGRLYNEKLAPWLESQEGRRQRARRLRWLIIGFGLAALVAVFFYLATREEEPSGFWFFLLFVAGMGVIIAGNILRALCRLVSTYGITGSPPRLRGAGPADAPRGLSAAHR